MEISAIFGKARMDKCAAIHNRTFLSNLPSIDHEGRSLESIVLVSNPDLWNHKAFPPPKPLFLDDPFYEPPPSEAQHRHEIEQALDLLKRCLALDPCKRLTAADALKHPWLRRPGVDEDADGPRKPEEGVCKRMHRVEEGNRPSPGVFVLPRCSSS
jgi:cell division control protein 7